MLPKRVGYSNPWKILPIHFYFLFLWKLPERVEYSNIAYTKNLPLWGMYIELVQNISTSLDLNRDKTER